MRKNIPILSKTLANPAHSPKFHSLSALSRLVPKIFDLGIYIISHAVNVLLVRFKSPIHYHFQMIHNFVIYCVDDIKFIRLYVALIFKYLITREKIYISPFGLLRILGERTLKIGRN